MRSAPALALLVGVSGLSFGPARARDCYRDGNAAYNAGRFGEAAALFLSNAEDPGCEASRARLLISAGEAFRRQGEQSGDNAWFCQARDAYERAERTTRRARLIEVARSGAKGAAGRCRAAAATTPPPTAALAGPAVAAPPAEPSPVSEPVGEDDDGLSSAWIIAGVAAGVAVGVGVAFILASDDEPPPTIYRQEFAGDGE